MKAIEEVLHGWADYEKIREFLNLQLSTFRVFLLLRMCLLSLFNDLCCFCKLLLIIDSCNIFSIF